VLEMLFRRLTQPLPADAQRGGGANQKGKKSGNGETGIPLRFDPQKDLGNSQADTDHKRIVAHHPIGNEPRHMVAEVAIGVEPSRRPGRQESEQIAVRKILAQDDVYLTAGRAYDPVEPDDANVALAADIHRIIDPR